MKDKKGNKKTQKDDNLSINASFDDVIAVSVGKTNKVGKQHKQNILPKNKTKK